jgi:NADH-quinone oxidoreductase subunit E
MAAVMKSVLSPDALASIERECAKYPPEWRRSAVMAALRIAQDELGWLSVETMDHVAGLLGMRPIEVYEVATFYSMYDLKPVGRHKINVCTNISCMLCGSGAIVAHLESKLGIKLGETTQDGRFTLKEVECLQIDKTYYENLTPARVDEILAGLDRDG